MQVLTTHVLGSHAISRAVAPGMIERRARFDSVYRLDGVADRRAEGGGVQCGEVGLSGHGPCAGRELSPQGVRVNAIAPGWIE